MGPADTSPSVLFLTRKWPPAVGGMETYSAELIGELRKIPLEVELINLPGQPDGDAPSSRAILGFGLRTSLRLLTRRGTWNVVHGGDMAIWPLAWLAARTARTRPKVILSAHGTDVSLAFGTGLRRRIYRGYLSAARRLLPGQTTFIANSAATSAKLAQLAFTRSQTIPLGCRATVDEPATEDPKTLLFAGRLVARKGLSWFVREVLPQLPEDIHLTVAGTEWDASESAVLADPRVQFLGGLPQAQLWSRMRTALAVIIPNRHSGDHQFEGFGLVAAEAAASGGLVLAADLDGYRDSVIDGQTGRLLPPEDAAAWTRAITGLAQMTPAQRDALRHTARTVAQDQFSWSRVARETARLYDAL